MITYVWIEQKNSLIRVSFMRNSKLKCLKSQDKSLHPNVDRDIWTMVIVYRSPGQNSFNLKKAHQLVKLVNLKKPINWSNWCIWKRPINLFEMKINFIIRGRQFSQKLEYSLSSLREITNTIKYNSYQRTTIQFSPTKTRHSLSLYSFSLFTLITSDLSVGGAFSKKKKG